MKLSRKRYEALLALRAKLSARVQQIEARLAQAEIKEKRPRARGTSTAEIAAHFQRTIRTVQRWRLRGMPQGNAGSYDLAEIKAWLAKNVNGTGAVRTNKYRKKYSADNPKLCPECKLHNIYKGAETCSFCRRNATRTHKIRGPKLCRNCKKVYPLKGADICSYCQAERLTNEKKRYYLAEREKKLAYQNRNKDKIAVQRQARRLRYRNECHKTYVKGLIQSGTSLKFKEIPLSLVKAWGELLILKRVTKHQEAGKNERAQAA